MNLPPLTARDAAASSLLGALDLTGPPTFLDPPSLPEPSLKWFLVKPRNHPPCRSGFALSRR